MDNQEHLMEKSPADAEIARLLRRRSLLFWYTATSKQLHTSIEMPESHGIKGKLVAVDHGENRFRVDALETPLGTYSHVVLRGTDVDAMRMVLPEIGTQQVDAYDRQ